MNCVLIFFWLCVKVQVWECCCHAPPGSQKKHAFLQNPEKNNRFLFFQQHRNIDHLDDGEDVSNHKESSLSWIKQTILNFETSMSRFHCLSLLLWTSHRYFARCAPTVLMASKNYQSPLVLKESSLKSLKQKIQKSNNPHYDSAMSNSQKSVQKLNGPTVDLIPRYSGVSSCNYL